MHVRASHSPDGQVAYSMAMPIDRRTAFAGSGLPFPSAAVAFGPGQRGEVRSSGRDLALPGHTPNTFLGDDGVAVGPGAFLSYTALGEQVTEWCPAIVDDATQVPAGVPHRALTHALERTGPHYYDDRGVPVRSQNEILEASAYRRDSPGGWGGRPRR